MTNPPDPKTKTPIYPTPCLICGKPVEDYIAEYCCGGQDCGCLGLPIEPCLCSKECSAALFDNDGTMEERRIKAGIATAPTYATLELENQSLTRRLEEAEKKWHDAVELNRLYHDTRHDTRNFAKNAQQQRDDWQKESAELEAKLTALRSAAEGVMKALELANVTDDKFNDKNADFIEAALAALRAELTAAPAARSSDPAPGDR